MKINLEYVEIYIWDPYRFGLIAYLVDNPSFLCDLKLVRQKLGINEDEVYLFRSMFSLIGDSKHLTAKTFGNTFKKFRVSFKFLEEKYSNLDLENKKIKFDAIADNIRNSLDRFTEEADTLIKKYGLSKSYWEPMRKILLTNEVRDSDFENITYALILNNKDLKQLKLSEPLFSIVVTPESTEEEVVEIFRNYKQGRYYENKKEKKYWETRHKDTTPNIKRDREWYWLKEQGLTYREIHENHSKNITERGVIEAIRRYKEVVLLLF